MSGISDFAVTKLDVLTGFDTLKICVGYRVGEETIQEFPQSQKIFKQSQPVYEEMPGWYENLTHVRRFEDLPEAAKNYILRIEELTGVPATLVAIGPGREQTIVRGEIF